MSGDGYVTLSHQLRRFNSLRKHQYSIVVLFASMLFLLMWLVFPLNAQRDRSGYAAVSAFDGGPKVKRCKVIEWKRGQRRYARSQMELDIGDPRTVRLIYFLPHDRTFRGKEVQRIKDDIRRTRDFFAEQMEAHGNADTTFRFEADAEGEPIVHRVDGQHPESYFDNNAFDAILGEVDDSFDIDTNVYAIVIDNSTESVDGAAGLGSRRDKQGGVALMPTGYTWVTLAHELGHAFGLEHDFRDSTYIMSYGPFEDKVSACNADYLAVHPHFNDAVSIEESSTLPAVDFISEPWYANDASSVSVKVNVSAAGGLHQVLLMVNTIFPHYSAGFREVKSCRGFTGESGAVVAFDYDGAIPSNEDLVSYNEENEEFGFPRVAESSLSYPIAHPITIIAVDTDGNVHYEALTLSEISLHHVLTLEGHTDSVETVSYSPDGRTLASASWDGTVKLWNVESGDIIFNLDGHSGGADALSFSPDGRTIASGSWDGAVKLWDFESGENIFTLEEHTGGVDAVSYSPDGRTLASASWDSTVKLWAIEPGKIIATLEGVSSAATSVSFSPDGHTLAVGTMDGAVQLWDVESREMTAALEEMDPWNLPPAVSAVSFSPGGNTLASGAYDGTAKIWDVEAESVLRTFRHSSEVSSVSFSSDGRFLASGAWGGTVTLWDVLYGEKVDAFGHSSGVNSVAFSPNGDALVSGTNAGTIEMWNLEVPASVKPLSNRLALLGGIKRTALLQNYPNPFNPETWIPYQLAVAGDVTLTIYDARGRLVRQLDLGHREAGFYTDQTHAAHWDGRNQSGEPVASGVFFYQLRAGDYSFTSQLVILK